MNRTTSNIARLTVNTVHLARTGTGAGGCLCICAPAGHHHGVCQSTAQPGLFVTITRSHAQPVRLAACRPCYDAVRQRLWAGVTVPVRASA